MAVTELGRVNGYAKNAKMAHLFYRAVRKPHVWSHSLKSQTIIKCVLFIYFIKRKYHNCLFMEFFIVSKQHIRNNRIYYQTSNNKDNIIILYFRWQWVAQLPVDRKYFFVSGSLRF